MGEVEFMVRIREGLAYWWSFLRVGLAIVGFLVVFFQVWGMVARMREGGKWKY